MTGWPGTRDDAELDPTLYSGTSGIIVTLLEASRHFQDEAHADAALAGARYVASPIDDADHCSLYFGLTGMAFALASIARELNDGESAAAAARVLALVRTRFDGERWSDQFELLGGNAGIVRELLRYSRVTSRRDPRYAVAWPDHPPVATSILSPDAGVDGP